MVFCFFGPMFILFIYLVIWFSIYSAIWIQSTGLACSLPEANISVKCKALKLKISFSQNFDATVLTILGNFLEVWVRIVMMTESELHLSALDFSRSLD